MVKRFRSLKLDTKLRILEKMYTIINSVKTMQTTSVNPLINTFNTLTNSIIRVDRVKDQNRANLVWKLETTAPKAFNTK